jgi:hypothetical protein
MRSSTHSASPAWGASPRTSRAAPTIERLIAEREHRVAHLENHDPTPVDARTAEDRRRRAFAALARAAAAATRAESAERDNAQEHAETPTRE